jgi:hypothetical protein
MASIIPYEMGNLFKKAIINRGEGEPAGLQILLNPKKHIAGAYREGLKGGPGIGTKIGARVRRIVKGYEDPSELVRI